ncbi:MAG: tRNA (adenosine(37)-N6)-threonylcarbamoyltransferase complex ATPase subunit type 1 TsaE [Chitinophagaceae bacterium]|nr:tRNA (adenosine(37)-N6)-threonylcarbamoyltransferase complex ATPase subunit type 1 TsaE [Chitinophagaceae bacterium]
MEMIVALADIYEKARQFWQAVNDGKIIAFHGEMGSGKTTFIHALCEVKHVSSSFSSPTFSIINEYLFPGGAIFHIDLYRLKDEDEAIRAGVEDCFYSGNICLVEWPEKAPGIFPENTLHIYVDFIDSRTRRLRLGDK